MEQLEIEIKLRMDAPRTRFAARLRSLGATLKRPRHFEDNFLFDDRKGRLRRGGSLLRLRLAGGRAILTFKGPGRILRGAKARDELETEIGEGATLVKVLEAIGLRPAFRYQKYRTLYRLGRVLIALDETPMGDYLEVEGSPPGIARVAGRLGYQPRDFITASYYDLFVSYRKSHRLRSRDMILGIKASRQA